MSNLLETLNNVQFIINSEGEQTSVVLDLKTWELLLDYLTNQKPEKLVTEKSDQLKQNEIMQFAGCWNDLTESNFNEFSEDIENRRQNSLSRRFNDETLFT